MTDVATGTHGTLTMTATEVATNPAANTSDVYWELWLFEATTSNTTFNLSAIGASVTVDGAGAWSGSFTFDWRPAGLQSTLIASGTTTVTHGADGVKSLNVTGHMNSTSTTGAGGATDATQPLDLTTLILAPTAPSAVSATRVSDTQQTVAWTPNPATRAPYASQYVLRSTNGGGFANIATVAGSATSYSDTTTSAGNKYVYEIQANNATGSTTSSAATAVFTTPGSPTGAAAAKDTSNNIVITWANGCAYAEYQTEVWESQNGGAYSLLTTVSTGVATYTHASPSTSVTHQYEVRAKTSSGTTLYSAYSVTSVVSLTSAPNAPTGLAPTGLAQNGAAAIVFTWVHNPTDTTPQSKFQIEHRLTGGSWTTVTAVTSTVSSWTLPAGTYANGQTVEWHVRTYGQNATASPYSATASFVTSTPPTAAISTPANGGTLTVSSVAAAWTYYQAESSAQAAWQAQLLDVSSVVLEVLSASNAATTATFATHLNNTSTYTVRVQVQSAAGTWSAWATSTFTTAFLPPANVTITPAWDQGHGWIVLTLAADNPVGGVTVAVSSVAIQRRRNGGAWVAFAGSFAGTAVVVDTSPTTCGLNEYRAVVSSATQSSATMAIVSLTTTEGQWAYLSTGPGFGDVSRLFANPTLAPTDGLAKELHQFAGRTLPVQFSGIAQTSAVAITAVLESTSGTVADFQARALASTICLWRDPSGRVLFGSLSPVAFAADSAQLASISFTVTRVDYTG